MTNANDARRIVLQSLSPVPPETAQLRDLLHRIAAEDIVASDQIPPFDNSGMDGYALRASETAGSQGDVVLQVQGEVFAGRPFPDTLHSGNAIRITTGAPIPPDADAVIEQELVKVRNGDIVVSAVVERGRNIRRRGEDVAAGAVVVKKGTRIGPAAMGVLASLGVETAKVHRRIRVGILATGNEVVEFNQKPKPGQIRNSNAVALEAMLKEDGHEAILLGTAEDRPDDLAQKISAGLEADALITSGGVSVGQHDYMLKVLKDLEVELKFWKLNIKPGMPMAFGVAKALKPIFALPGNPVSTLVTYRQFVRPGLERLAGVEQPGLPVRVQAILMEDLRKNDGKKHFVRGVFSSKGGRIEVRPTGSQSSAVLSSLSKANCLVILPEDVRNPVAGTAVEIELL